MSQAKKILVLAASTYQLEVIKTAKRLGYYVITTDNIPDNPGHILADKNYQVDTTDKERILQIAIEEKISGIIAACTDIAVPTAAFVAEKIGLPGCPLQSAEILCSKIEFRQFLGRELIPVPENYVIDQQWQPDDSFFRSEQQWIIKPDRSSGSKGIFIISSLEDYQHYLPETLIFSSNGKGILERYINGFQGTCEGILQKGKVALAVILDRRTVEPPYVVTCGHLVPSKLPISLQKRLLALIEHVMEILQVKNGPFDCDFVAFENEIYLLEITPRIGGNSISKLIREALGFEIVEYSIRHVLGEDYSLLLQNLDNRGVRPSAIVIFGLPGKGRLQYDQKEFQLLQQEEWVKELSFDLAINELTSPFINGRNRIGEALISSYSREDLELKILELTRRLDIKCL